MDDVDYSAAAALREIYDLLKMKIEKIKPRKKEKTLASTFKEAAQDRERLRTLDEWKPLDAEEWD